MAWLWACPFQVEYMAGFKGHRRSYKISLMAYTWLLLNIAYKIPREREREQMK